MFLKAIWNWLDTYPEEFTDLQKRPNAELSGNVTFTFIFTSKLPSLGILIRNQFTKNMQL